MTVTVPVWFAGHIVLEYVVLRDGSTLETPSGEMRRFVNEESARRANTEPRR